VLHHAQERRGPDGRNLHDASGVERGCRGSRTLALPFEHRSFYRRQARDERPGWWPDCEHSDRIDCLRGRRWSQHDSSFGSCYHDHTDLSSLFILQADRRTRRSRTQGISLKAERVPLRRRNTFPSDLHDISERFTEATRILFFCFLSIRKRKLKEVLSPYGQDSSWLINETAFSCRSAKLITAKFYGPCRRSIEGNLVPLNVARIPEFRCIEVFVHELSFSCVKVACIARRNIPAATWSNYWTRSLISRIKRRSLTRN